MLRATLISATLGEDQKVEPPLGPLYIAAALESLGWSVDFRDFQLCADANAFDPDCLVDFLKGHEPYLLISCFVDMLPVVLAACHEIKAARPNAYVLLGGPGPTAGAAAILRAFPQVDAIVIGEGEDTIKDWAKAVAVDPSRPQSPIAGMVFRNGCDIIEGPKRARIPDSSEIAPPAYHLLDWTVYTGARIITTRGCPYRCSFCDVAPIWQRKAVYRDVEETIDEMVMLRDTYGMRGIAIVDDTFVLNRGRVEAFCNALIRRHVNLQWGCFGRINLMSERLIALMAKAGCRAIFYGIDSGSSRILQRTLKELDRQSIVPTLAKSAEYFDRIEASFIWGYPFETFDDFCETIDIAGEASLLAPRVNVQLHMLSPLPSSPLFHEFGDELLEPEHADREYLLLPGLLLDDRAGRVKQIIHTAPELFPGFFTFPTPDRQAKREVLVRVHAALDCLVGRTMFEQSVFDLMTRADSAVERLLIDEAGDPAERIGLGLALGLFRRTRRRKAAAAAFDGERGRSMVRVRNDH